MQCYIDYLRELRTQGLPATFDPAHHALLDAISLLIAVAQALEHDERPGDGAVIRNHVDALAYADLRLDTMRSQNGTLDSYIAALQLLSAHGLRSDASFGNRAPDSHADD